MIDIDKTDLHRRHAPQRASDRLARAAAGAMGAVATRLFAHRYGPGAVVLETVSAVPGMVGAALLHLRCLRRLEDDGGWVRALMDEADNQRIHLMVFVALARPGFFERLMILLAQGLFWNAYFLLYLVSRRTAHRLTGYFEEIAVASYSRFLAEIEAGRQPNPPAPRIAIDYWGLTADARLRDIVEQVRGEEAIHRDVNHGLADRLDRIGRIAGPTSLGGAAPPGG